MSVAAAPRTHPHCVGCRQPYHYPDGKTDNAWFTLYTIKRYRKAGNKNGWRTRPLAHPLPKMPNVVQ